MEQFTNLKQLITHFSDEKTCREYLEQQRWNGKPVCPYCGCSEKVYRIEKGKRYKCGNKDCHKKFSITVGTIFENSKIALSTWFAAVYLATAHKKGISSLQLHRDLGVTQKTAWFMLHRIRESMRDKAPDMLSGTVEADETFVGGKNKNRHADKKVKFSQGRSFKDKTPVLGMIQRKGKLVTRVVKDTKAKTLKPVITQMVQEGTVLITDDWDSYKRLAHPYVHQVIKHGEGEYSREGFHTNNIEGFWSLLKRGIFGIYHYTSPKHLNRYCDEFSYRYNTRKIADTERFTLSLSKINGRLTYKNLISCQ